MTSSNRGSFYTALVQVLASVSSGFILYAIAVITPPDRFGVIALIFTLLAAIIGCMRGAIGMPLLLKAGAPLQQIRAEAAMAVGTSLSIGLALAAIIAGAGFIIGGAEAFILAAAVPLILGQDALRFVAITLSRPEVAARWDAIWSLGTVGLLVFTWVRLPIVTPTTVTMTWALLATVAMIGLSANLRIRPRFAGLLGWFRRDWLDRLRYAADKGLEQVGVFIMLAAVTAVISAPASGALRGATAVLAPVAIIVSAVPLIVIPDTARDGLQPTQTWRRLSKIAVLSAIIAVASGAVLGVLPDEVGGLMLGQTFSATKQVVVIIAVEYAIGCWCVAVATYLRAHNRSADALALRVLNVVVALSTTLAAAWWMRTAPATALGLAVGTTVVTLAALIWFTPWRHTRRRRRGLGSRFQRRSSLSITQSCRTVERAP